ncbi:hypothetical protein Clacol_005017 [Clathrus columnatus]|uniref:Protein HIR n=1 Tax=Clathrus columnatus TaxID=1419009 RepID=A0AAV5AC54_9AGAM|nr:hypothetical protein Clacol_005017 [Clathrus columnatus]
MVSAANLRMSINLTLILESGEKDSKKRLSIFSIHVHPDGSRIATGGLDAKIRIWPTKPILYEDALESGFPTHLSTLSMHAGPVLTVRWAHSGKWLASGSDDTIVMIWDLDPNGGGKAWGSDEINIESWKPLKRLPGHESDVTDLAWAPEDRYLASVGLDSKVIVWCGLTLQQLVCLDSHQGFVKGVCWDPVGQFMATQSDDRTVKIWRAVDWGLEATITKPFKDSPGNTFFRRLSWSPDGAHITASNAMNNNGAVFVAAVIGRLNWTSDISLVGHENTVEVACYNPHIFLRNPKVLLTGVCAVYAFYWFSFSQFLCNQAPVTTSNICSRRFDMKKVVALGADDCSVSIWQTKSARPLIVTRNVFDRQILDLSWSLDGLTLYACSSDGSIAVFSFEEGEIEGIAPTSVQKQYLQKYGYVPAPPPTRAQDPLSQSEPHAIGTGEGFGSNSSFSTNGSGHINKLIARRGGKKRIQPTFVGTLGGGGSSGSPASSSQPTFTAPPQPPQRVTTPDRSFNQTFDSAINGIHSTATQGITSTPFGASRQPPPSNDEWRMYSSDSHQGMSAYHSTGDHTRRVSPSSMSLDNGGVGGPNIDVFNNSIESKSRRKPNDNMEVDIPRGRARTLGGDHVRESGAVREIRGDHDIAGGIAPSSNVRFRGDGWRDHVLSIPSVKTFLSVRVEGTEDVLEGANFDDGRPTEVLFVSNKQTQWLDYLHSPVIALAVTTDFCAVAMADGSLNVYSHTGRKMMLTITLTAPISFLEAAKSHLMAVTASGDLTVWNVKTQKAGFPPTSILPLFTEPNITIVNVGVRTNGIPIINLSSGVAHSYDPSLLAWVRISQGWWADGSDAWTGRQRNNSFISSRGIVAILEAGITELLPDRSLESIERATWWNAAKTLGHLEERQAASKLLDSPAEFKHSLLLYAKKLSEEGFRGKAEELIRELFGPVYWRPNSNRDEKWDPYVVGLSKRDLLREVLNIFGNASLLLSSSFAVNRFIVKGKTLQKLGTDWQDMLRRSAAEDI